MRQCKKRNQSNSVKSSLNLMNGIVSLSKGRQRIFNGIALTLFYVEASVFLEMNLTIGEASSDHCVTI